jgi:hypothetical protein
MAILGEVPNLLTVVPRVPDWRKLLWWPSYHLLLWCRRSAGKLLLSAAAAGTVGSCSRTAKDGMAVLWVVCK